MGYLCIVFPLNAIFVRAGQAWSRVKFPAVFSGVARATYVPVRAIEQSFRSVISIKRLAGAMTENEIKALDICVQQDNESHWLERRAYVHEKSGDL